MPVRARTVGHHRRVARTRALALLALVLCGLIAAAGAVSAQGTGGIVTTRVEGAITPVIADHLDDVLTDAAADDASLVVIGMDTPGGLDTSMRAIVQDLLSAPVPVAVYVGPPGARAASAGSVIALSANVIGMAPGTNIGAATPIDLQAGEVADKVVADAAAYVEAVAEERGRSEPATDFYVDTVTEGESLPASDALEAGAIDVIAEDLDDFLAQIDGREVQVRGRGTVTLDLAGQVVREVDLSLTRGLLQRLASPDLAFVLISIGSLAIVYEIANPGGGFGGAVGAILLIMAFFSLSVLPVNVAGVLLLVVAAACFVAEAFVPGIGAFAAGGAVATAVAGLVLVERPTGLGVSLGLALGMAAVVGAAAVGLGYLAVRTRNAPPVVGTAGTIVGAVGVVKQAEGTTGQVLVEGARWQAASMTPLVVGGRVEVVGVDGLVVTVEPVGAGLPTSSS